MNIKTITGIASLLIILPAGVFAQYPTQNQRMLQSDTPAGTHNANIDQRAIQKMSKLDAIVHLTAEQRSQLQPTYIQVERQEYKNNQTTQDKETLKQLNNKLYKEKWIAWHKFLTAEQLSTWEDYRKANATEEY